MSLIKWNGKPGPYVPTKLTEAMRNAVSTEDLTNE